MKGNPYTSSGRDLVDGRLTGMSKRVALLGSLAAILSAANAVAQPSIPMPRPADERPSEAPWYQSDRQPVLPPIEQTLGIDPSSFSANVQTFVNGYRFVGNTVFTDEELDTLAAAYKGRSVSALELETLRQLISAHYVQHGYVNSGAVYPDQDVEDQVVTVQIVEGRLVAVETTGVERLPRRYLTDRVEADDRPLNIQDLERKLRRIERDPLVSAVNAELRPGPTAGTGTLFLDIREAKPYWFELAADNSRAPSVGEWQGVGRFTHYNLLGFADTLAAEVGFSDGLVDGFVNYRFPMVAGHGLEIGYRRTHGDVIEEPFEDLDIESRSDTWRFGTFHTLRDTLTQTVNLAFRLERRKTETELLGMPFSFSPGAEAGVYRVTVLRAAQDLSWRGRQQALGFRSTVSFGLDAFDATKHQGGIEDGQFVSWLAQASWGYRFLESGLEIAARADLQLSNNPLLPVEQFSIGGDYSVRGYRRNQLIRDQGFVASLEARVPLKRTLEGRPILQLAVFADYGRGWNKERDLRGDKEIASLGLGLRWNLKERLIGHLYWGGQLRDVPTPQDQSLQDHGWHFSVNYHR